MLLVFTPYDCFKQFNRPYIVSIHSKMSQFAAPESLHIYPIQWLTNRMQRANQFFPSTGGRRIWKSLNFGQAVFYYKPFPSLFSLTRPPATQASIYCKSRLPKLNSFPSLVELVLMSSFCSLKRIIVQVPLDGTLIHRRLAPSRCWYSCTVLERMESWVSLDSNNLRKSSTASQEQCLPYHAHIKPYTVDRGAWGQDLQSVLSA